VDVGRDVVGDARDGRPARRADRCVGAGRSDPVGRAGACDTQSLHGTPPWRWGQPQTVRRPGSYRGMSPLRPGRPGAECRYDTHEELGPPTPGDRPRNRRPGTRVLEVPPLRRSRTKHCWPGCAADRRALRGRRDDRAGCLRVAAVCGDRVVLYLPVGTPPTTDDAAGPDPVDVLRPPRSPTYPDGGPLLRSRPQHGVVGGPQWEGPRLAWVVVLFAVVVVALRRPARRLTIGGRCSPWRSSP